MATDEAVKEISGLIKAVEKNSNFKQLATYSINLLTKAARSHESIETRASEVVIAALTKHQSSADMLSCAAECLAALAADPRQAQVNQMKMELELREKMTTGGALVYLLKPQHPSDPKPDHCRRRRHGNGS